MGYELGSVLKKKDIPKTDRGAGKYDKLLKNVASLRSDEALEVKIEKPHNISAIRKAVDKGFKHSSYHVVQRKDPETKEIYCYIYKAD